MEFCTALRNAHLDIDPALYSAMLDDFCGPSARRGCGSQARGCGSQARKGPSPNISESAGGWLLVVPLPGCGEASVALNRKGDEDVSVEVVAPSANYSERFALPRQADADAVTASLRYGELRVAVPRRAPVAPRNLEVQAAEPDSSGSVPTEAVTLDCPGFGPEDITVQLDFERRQLLVFAAAAESDSEYPLRRVRLPKWADASPEASEHFSAYCVNGQLTVRCPTKPSFTPLAVPVSADETAEPGEGEVLLLNEELPGVSASDVGVEVTGRKVNVSLNATPSRASARRFFAVCPSEGSNVRASCKDGLLLVVATVNEPVESTTAIPLATDAPATLPEAPATPIDAEEDEEEFIMADAASD